MRCGTNKHGVECWEYVATYVDDLCIAMRDPKELLDKLQAPPFNYGIKGDGPIRFHLGCGFKQDEDGTLVWDQSRYIGRLLDSYKRHFGHEPNVPKKSAMAPLADGDHPELDDSALLEPDDIRKYQSIIGGLQWCVTIGRFDIQAAVATMSRFAQAPRQGHMDRLHRICSYLKHFADSGIRVRTEIPDLSQVPKIDFPWEHTVYTGAHEVLPDNAPAPLGKSVVTIHYKDANLEHCKLTGRAMGGNFDLVNGTPIGWHGKLQTTVECASYGSESAAGRIAVDRIIDLRTRLRYLGVPIQGPSYLFGDNRAVCDAALPHSKLTKRHNALNWHRIREAIAAKILRFIHIEGKTNPSDILSKHCGYAAGWPVIRPLLFWKGNAKDCLLPHEHVEGVTTVPAVPVNGLHSV